LGDNF